MRANTDRHSALVFGKVVDHYDRGRPCLSLQFVSDVSARLGTALGGHHLEVGSGTGQLTAALLAAGDRVVGVEPSAPMARRLRVRFADDIDAGRFEVWDRTFETVDPGLSGSFDHIWSSDAWHWIDPSVGYRLAADLLKPGGYVITTWGFPVVADTDLAEALNTVYSELSPDLVRAAGGYLAEIEPLLAAGRRQVNDSGVLRVVDHWVEETQVAVSAASYVDWQLSYAHIAALDEAERRQLGQSIHDVIVQSSEPSVVRIRVWRYTAASRQPSVSQTPGDHCTH
jgi:SAM-dependent methyltransferase